MIRFNKKKKERKKGRKEGRKKERKRPTVAFHSDETMRAGELKWDVSLSSPRKENETNIFFFNSGEQFSFERLKIKIIHTSGVKDSFSSFSLFLGKE